MVDIMLDLERLRQTRDGLTATVSEFDSAAKTSDGLEDAIGRPDDRGELREKASDFESAWNDKRGRLGENLESILERLTGIVDGWDEWDRDTASSLDGAEASGTVRAEVAL